MPSHSQLEAEAHQAAVPADPGAVKLNRSSEMFLGAIGQQASILPAPAWDLIWSKIPTLRCKEHWSPWSWTGDDSFPKQLVGNVGLELGSAPKPLLPL